MEEHKRKGRWIMTRNKSQIETNGLANCHYFTSVIVSNPSVVKEWLAKLEWFDVNSRMASSAYAPFAPYVPNTVE